jgi:hypothetical protein
MGHWRSYVLYIIAWHVSQLEEYWKKLLGKNLPWNGKKEQIPSYTDSLLRVLYYYAWSLLPKLDELRAKVTLEQLHIFVL